MTRINPADPFPADRVQKVVLKNGLRVLLLPDSTAPVTAVVTRVHAGYFDEPDDVIGIAHVLEHMFFKGTARRGVGDIARETKSVGGYLNAHTIYDNTTYYTVVPSSGLSRALDIQADAFSSSEINRDELGRELEVIIEEAKRKTDNPSALASESAYELLHDTHRIRRWRIGREAGLRKLTRENLLSFYRNFYTPSNAILVVAGDFDADSLLRDIRDLYGNLRSSVPDRSVGPEENSLGGFRFRELVGDIAQTQAVVAWRTPSSLHPDTPALDFVASILSAGRASRLYRAVRERKFAASVSASNYTPTELGVFSIHSEGEPEKSLDAVRAIWSEVAILREHVPADSEMTRVKSLFESRWVRQLETMEGKANYLAEWEGLGDWRMGAAYYDRILSLSAAEVRDAAAKYLKTESAAVFFYRPAKSPAIAADAVAMLSLLETEAIDPVSTVSDILVPSAHTTRRAQFAEGVSGVHVFRTHTQIPILVRRRESAPIVYMQIQATGGSALETMATAGITNLAARCSVKGTERYSAAQIAMLAEEMGGSISVSAGRDSVTWSLSVPRSAFENGFSLLAEVVRSATIDEAAVETERRAVLSNLALLRDDMFSYPVTLAALAAFSGHPYGIPVSGTEESVQRTSASAIRDWYRTRILESEWVVGLVGDVDPQHAADTVAGALGDLTQSSRQNIPDATWPSNFQFVAEVREKAQTAIALAFCGPTRNDPDRYTAALIATVASGLGGKFFEELRDRQSLAYTVYAYTASHPAGGIFMSYIATSPEKEEAARAGLLREFAKLASIELSAEEVERAKTYSIGSHTIRNESSGALLADIISAWSFGGGLRELTEYESRVRAVTPQDIRSFAERYFDPSRRVEGIVRGSGRVV